MKWEGKSGSKNQVCLGKQSKVIRKNKPGAAGEVCQRSTETWSHICRSRAAELAECKKDKLGEQVPGFSSWSHFILLHPDTGWGSSTCAATKIKQEVVCLWKHSCETRRCVCQCCEHWQRQRETPLHSAALLRDRNSSWNLGVQSKSCWLTALGVVFAAARRFLSRWHCSLLSSSETVF